MIVKIEHEIIGNPLTLGWVIAADDKNLKFSIESKSPQNKEGISIRIKEGKIFLLGLGNIECLLKRGEITSRLITPSSKIVSIEGPVKDKDEFIVLAKSEKILILKAEISIPVNLPNITNLPQKTPIQPIKKISPVRIALAGLIDQILRFLPEKEKYVKRDLDYPENSKKKKLATILGALLFLLLTISIVFGKYQKNNLSQKAKYMPTLTSIEHNLSEAENLAAVNNVNSRQLILDSKRKIEDLIAQKIKDPKIDELKNRIERDLGNIAGVYEEEPSVFLDLTLLNKDFKGTDMAADSNRLIVLDKNNRRLETINIKTGRADPVSVPDILPGIRLASLYSDRNFILTNNGIWEIDGNAKNAVPKKNNFGDNILISAYAGNFYILDKNTSSLWRFQGDGGSFGTKENWLAQGVKPDLSNVTSWSIDGNVWLLTNTYQILKLGNGNPLDFSLKNIDEDPKAIDIYTNEDNKYIYLLDKVNKRVLVIDKEGNYKAQYLINNIQNATKIIASESAKKIILLESDKLFSLDIKHLD